MVFPKTMREYGLQLEEDAVVCVKGRLDLREEPAKLICLELSRPVLDTEGLKPLLLNLPTASLTQTLVDRVKRVLLDHPGDTPVHLRVGEKILRLPDGFHVDARNGLLPELRELLGTNGLVVS
jgi:DNA polymerase-3 subunit alpha